MTKEELKEVYSKNIGKLRSIAFGEETEIVETVETTEETKEEATEVAEKFVDVNLADGRVASIEPAVELGASVAVDGEPAPDGTHELADGVMIVTVAGIITEIPEAEEETEEAETKVEETAPEEMNDVEGTPKVVTETVSIEKKFDAEEEVKAFDAEAAINELKEELEEARKSDEEFKKTVVEAFENFKKEPSVEPTKKRSKSPFKSGKETKSVFIKK